MKTRNIQKVLVANRGEIASRIFRTLRSMGIRSVAIYSDSDRGAAFLDHADERVSLGGQTSEESYLDVKKIIAAGKKTGAQALHPGYGFLSENADFAQACASEGITFIGPKPEIIRTMGNKTLARETMQKAGVPVVPGFTLENRDYTHAELSELGEKVGFPLLIKASYGGGGKGMRRVTNPTDLHVAIARARSEAQSVFGKSDVYLEREIQEGRHIEVQVLGDLHGHYAHLGERDCSMQRRHQKVIEESPTPARARHADAIHALCEVGQKAAQALGYTSAGTIEFIFSEQSGEFFFLEMNTRLQVEHPITELRAGLDLVREQINIAQGGSIAHLTHAKRLSGHAIECRIYAEDPDEAFRPSPGAIAFWSAPQGPHVRVDAALHQEDFIPSFFDPMIAKISVRGESRTEATASMLRALSETRVLGVHTNRDFLMRLLQSEAWQEGRYDIKSIELGLGMQPTQLPMSPYETAIAACVAQCIEQREDLAAQGQRPMSASLSTWQQVFSVSKWR